MFYRCHVAAVERFVARRIQDPHAVEDITSEVFLAAVRSCRRFDPSGPAPVAWLFGISFRLTADYQRKSARRWRAQSRQKGQRELADDAIERLEQRIDAERAAFALRDELAKIPAQTRSLLELTALDGLSITDAAAALGIAPGAARVRLHRAKTRLRNELADSPLRAVATELDDASRKELHGE
ncbi:sigma-70 family RNA polymerase sigma factor [Leucobacter viscericola]|uniref:Sigma-70 family RNA polymerase sigma factor n=1 Tax=Leucobacter viscericola TaxID=2714935 RepID=A0A6G7XJY1_9MICO|nr:sigma-70 family RNA polymerase sigma factor [Leucobacter viscericola]QIK64796.1 sigma-70 family RNA polymerase sigma factor [Leucobacter viscericola]